MTKKKKSKKKNPFCCCFGGSGKASEEYDELTPPTLAKDTSDYEYVVENMSIRKAPKKLLDETTTSKKNKHKIVVKDSSTSVVKKVPPEVFVAPVTKVDDAFLEISSSDNLDEDQKKPRKPTVTSAPIYEICESHRPPMRRPGVASAFHAQTKHLIGDNALKTLLMPYPVYQNQDSEKKKVSADIHKPNVEEDIPKCPQVIPPDIKEAIEALKVARPLHINSKISPTNRRNLIRSSSCTSCDKETLCDFTDENENEKRPRTPKIKRRHFTPNTINASSSTSDFPEHVRCNQNISSNLESSEKVRTTDSIQGQSLKWKIIINKHKTVVDKSC